MPAGKSSACELEPEVLGRCLLVVCQMFVFLMTLHARGNLDLESPEELLTSSGTPGPGALRANSFWTLYFCTIVRDDLLHRFFMCCWWSSSSIRVPCWHHFPCFSIIFRASILHRCFINFARTFMYLLKTCCWFPWSYIQLSKPSKTFIFILLVHGLTFRKHMFVL